MILFTVLILAYIVPFLTIGGLQELTEWYSIASWCAVAFITLLIVFIGWKPNLSDKILSLMVGFILVLTFVCWIGLVEYGSTEFKWSGFAILLVTWIGWAYSNPFFFKKEKQQYTPKSNKQIDEDIYDLSWQYGVSP